MANLYDTNINKSINFLEQHIGGNNNDSQAIFQEQKNIINETDKKIDMDVGSAGAVNNNYNLLNSEFIYNNPRINPKDIDLQFKYIKDKNLNSSNDQIITHIDYINIDSSLRTTENNYIIDFYKKLAPNSIIFTDGSNEMVINIDNTGENIIYPDNLITLDGISYIKKTYKNINFKFFNNENSVVLSINKNYNYLNDNLGVYISIKILNYEGTYFGNIPISILNQVHKVVLNPNYTDLISFILPITYYAPNYNTEFLICDVEIEYYNIGNYPINMINANSPISTYNIIEYHRVIKTTDNSITVRLADNMSIYDASILQNNENIQIGKVLNVINSYPNASNFQINFDKIYKNILSIEMISSEIPNTIPTVTDGNVINGSIINSGIIVNGGNTINGSNIINNGNNALYWKNLFDGDYTYSITLPTGLYTYTELIVAIEKEISKVKRVTPVANINGGYSIRQYEYNIIKITANPSINLSSFKSYNKYILTNCFINCNNDNISIGTAIITIKQINHNLSTGQRIFINNALDYDHIPALYINTIDGHIVTVETSDTYIITLTNINPNLLLAHGTKGAEGTNGAGGAEGTGGGNDVEITTDNSFQLLFNMNNTCGSIFGFKFVGSGIAITPYTSFINDFTIKNTDQYLLTNNIIIPDIAKVNLSNQRYILLKSNDLLNTCNTANGITFFYKFNLEPCYNTDILYNRHVNTIHYFNPPLHKLDYLNLQLVNSNNNLINLYNLNYSFTLKIISISNHPENTNINPNVAKL
jgi:hypothetical protein